MADLTSRSNITKKDALDFHKNKKPGKLSITPSKPLSTARDLSLAYSPGVAIPCLEIKKDPDSAYDYTAKGNMVAIISNGTAVLGLGNLGALASKPVMEGKAVLFKRFADIDGIDIEVDTENVDEFCNCVKHLGKSWGGINLEDIKAPECFMIEQKLSELLDIPVFHDDQHGTAIVATAGLLNALSITGRNIEDIKMVVNGAGAAAIACVELLKAMGMPANNVMMCDRTGVISKDRKNLEIGEFVPINSLLNIFINSNKNNFSVEDHDKLAFVKKNEKNSYKLTLIVNENKTISIKNDTSKVNFQLSVIKDSIPKIEILSSNSPKETGI